MTLVVCAACGRHVKTRETACPFCRGVIASSTPIDGPRITPRLSRAAMFAGATTLAVASCAGYGMPTCSTEVSFVAPCGIANIATTCGGVVACGDGDTRGVCTIEPITHNCDVTVVLADGTTHEFPVTVTEQASCGEKTVVASPFGTQDFTSATCTK